VQDPGDRCGKETVLQNRLRWARWELTQDGKRLMNANSGDKSFSAFYVAGKDWYSALAFVSEGGSVPSLATALGSSPAAHCSR